jgi:hypothetical protein
MNISMLLRTGRNSAPQETPPMDMRSMTLAVAEHYHDARGLLGYAMFEAVQAHLFANELPWPLVVWGLTPHGGCLAYTHSPIVCPPTITLHPSLLGGTEKDNPWGRPPEWLGVLFALDSMIHECMHVAVNYARGPWQGGESSHNNPLWIAEVNRLAPLLGFHDVVAAMSKPTRIGSKIVRRSEGSTIPFDAVSKFSRSLRILQDTADAYYQARVLPFPVQLPPRWSDQYLQPDEHTPAAHLLRITICNTEGNAACSAL